MKPLPWWLALVMALVMVMSSLLQAGEAPRPQVLVIDQLTRTPVPLATITIDGVARLADEHGMLTIEDASGAIAARAPGYLRARINPVSGDESTRVIELTPFRPRAVYLSAFGITNSTIRNAALQLRETNRINALVIDMKDDRGVTPYRSAVREENGVVGHAIRAPKLRDFPGLLTSLRGQGFYLIARIVVFKDDPLARARPEWAVRDEGGAPWRDREKLQWIDPFSRDAWGHNLALAEEVAQLGFDEIQFDYVRFPDAPNLRFALPNTQANRTEAIVGFLRAARTRLAPYNVFISADIFGYVCWNRDDTSIGQNIELLGGSLDYISPMLYPSGFTWGIPGCANPTAEPGQIVRRSLVQAQARTGLPAIRFRPWLQAFRDYAFDRREFGVHEIQMQVDAAEAEGTDGWMLWNSRNHYDPSQLPH